MSDVRLETRIATALMAAVKAPSVASFAAILATPEFVTEIPALHRSKVADALVAYSNFLKVLEELRPVALAWKDSYGSQE